jgi:GntR family transcriptional regulator, N-acetylglucosamine utilization regulator
MALAHDVAEPLYFQIKELLLGEIRAGRYRPHERVPSERELSAAHGVSRMTARQALVELQRSGAIYTRVGKGTFVAPQKIEQQLRSVTSFSQQLHAQGEVPSSRVLAATSGLVDVGLTERLGIKPGDDVVTISRVRLADGRPLGIETAYLPAARVPGILRHDFTHESLYETLAREYGLDFINASQTIEAALADERELALLEMDHPAAVFRLKRLTMSSDGRSVEFVNSTYRGDLYQLHSNLESPSVVR